MEKIRKIRKWGNSHVILLTITDMKDFNLHVDQEVDISNIKPKKRGEKK